MSAATSIEVLASDGCRLHVRLLRGGSGAPVLFVHALAMDGGLWAEVAARMAGEAPLYAIDCRGHGLSDKPEGPYTTAQFADDLGAVLRQLGASKCHIVGCSMGGTVALAFAGRYPSQVASLTVIDATACYGTDVAAEWEARGRRPMQEGFAAMCEFQLSRWFSNAFLDRRPSVIATAVQIFLKNDPHAYLESCRMLGKADERGALHHYQGPACIVVGSDDYATPPAMAEEIASKLNGATLRVLPGLRHFTPIEAPELIACEVDAVIARAELAARSTNEKRKTSP